ncbi:MAG: HEAT repeat domain-containing protein [Phycisphaerales bacterium]|nr:MAG: HEAT repeat domain-containing protein [Phycisphaerales bacterium]
MSMTALWLYLGSAIALAIVACMLAAWACFSDRSRGRRRCPKCWYSIHESLSYPTHCSECGREIAREKDLHRTRRRWKWIGASAIVLFVAAFIAVQPKVQPFGWGSMTPMTALIFLLQFDDTDWVVRGIESQINYDLFHRRRAPDFLDHWNPAKEKAMWRWQWRWLGRTILPRLDDEDLDPFARRNYFDWIALCRDFAGDRQLHAEATEALRKQMSDEAPWARNRGWMLAVDYSDIDGSIDWLLERLENAPDDDAIWGAMMGLRVVAWRDRRGVDLLLEFLDHEHPRMRSGAVTNLGFVVHRNGFEAEIHDAVDAMKDDEDCDVRLERIRSLAFMLTEEHMWPMIVAAMESEDICVRRGGFGAGNTHVYEWRGRATTMPARIVELAVASIDDEDEAIRRSAAWIVAGAATDDRRRQMVLPHVEAIEQHAEHEDLSVKQAIDAALRDLRR